MRKALVLICGCLLLLPGCIELEETITINKDGTGLYESRQVFSEQLTTMLQSGMGAGGPSSMNLPSSKEELEQAFRGKGVRIVDSSFKIKDKRLTGEFRVEFDNAVEFFNTQGMQKRFQFFKSGNELHLRSVKDPGMSSKELSPDRPEGGKVEDAMEKAMKEAMKEFLKDFKVDITINMPDNISESNAMKVKGRSAHWIIDEKTLLNPGTAMVLSDQLWARCSADGLGFIPLNESDYPDDKLVADYTSDSKSEGTEAGTKEIAEEKGAGEDAAGESRAGEDETTENASSLQPPKKEGPAKKSPEEVTIGGKSFIYLKNGARFQVDRYYRKGDTLTYTKFGGTVSINISDIQAVQEISE